MYLHHELIWGMGSQFQTSVLTEFIQRKRIWGLKYKYVYPLVPFSVSAIIRVSSRLYPKNLRQIESSVDVRCVVVGWCLFVKRLLLSWRLKCCYLKHIFIGLLETQLIHNTGCCTYHLYFEIKACLRYRSSTNLFQACKATERRATYLDCFFYSYFRNV